MFYIIDDNILLTRKCIFVLLFKLQWNLYSGDTHETKASVPRLLVGRVFINDFYGQSVFKC